MCSLAAESLHGRAASITAGAVPLRATPARRTQTELYDAYCGSIAAVEPTPFQVTITGLDEGIQVVAVQGELDLSTAPELERPLEDVLEGPESVLIDLRSCDFIDSTGIALLVRAWQRLEAEDNGRNLAICSNNEQVRRVLEITGLEVSIPVHETREQAAAALRG